MKHLRRFGIALLGLTAVTGILVACGDDDGVLLAVAGTDGGLDHAAPQATPDAAKPGSDASDAASDDDDAGDSGTDADANQAPADAGADVIIPPVDAGSPDADAGDLVKEFPARLAAEACKSFSRCCFGDSNTENDAGVDGGHFNQTKCLTTYSVGGVDQSNPGNGANLSRLTYNASKASECLGRMQVISCGANAAEYRALVDACYAVLTGTVAPGGACNVSVECQPGNFCNTSVGGGTCEAIRAVGASCGDWTTNPTLGQHTCSNRFSGEPPRFCSSADAGTFDNLPPASWKCSTSQPNGAACLNTTWCSDGVCSGGKCADFLPIYSPNGCKAFVQP